MSAYKGYSSLLFMDVIMVMTCIVVAGFYLPWESNIKSYQCLCIEQAHSRASTLWHHQGYNKANHTSPSQESQKSGIDIAITQNCKVALAALYTMYCVACIWTESRWSWWKWINWQLNSQVHPLDPCLHLPILHIRAKRFGPFFSIGSIESLY